MMEVASRLVLSLLLIQSVFVLASPQLEVSHIRQSELDEVSTVQRLPAPAACKKLKTDADWPSIDVINAELPGWEEPMPDGKKKHPDYIYEAKSVASVQRAVKFAAKHNVRLSIINSGHDFMGK
jgi:hypothetical protein